MGYYPEQSLTLQKSFGKKCKKTVCLAHFDRNLYYSCLKLSSLNCIFFSRRGVGQEVEKGGNKVDSESVKTVKLPKPTSSNLADPSFHPGSLSGFGRLESDRIRPPSTIERSSSIAGANTQKNKVKSKTITFS